MITIGAVINGTVVLGFAAFLGWRGYERGVIRTVQGMVSIVSGYFACYFFIETFSIYLEKYFSLHGLQSYVISGLCLLLGASALTSLLLSYFISHLEEQEQEPAHIAGMLVGVTLGCLLGVITVWLAGITMDAVQLNQGGVSSLQGKSTDPVRKMAGNMVGAAVEYAIEKKTGDEGLAPVIAGQLVGDPVTMSQQLVQVSKSEEIQQFFSDPVAQSLMQNNQIEELQHNAAFQRWIQTPQANEFLSLLGSSIKTGNITQAGHLSKEERTAQLLTNLYQKATRLKANPRYTELSQSPEIKQLLQNPSLLAMATNPALKELAEIVFSNKSSGNYVVDHQTLRSLNEKDSQPIDKLQWEKVKPVEQSLNTTEKTEETTVEDPHIVYRWTDENGEKHFAQKKPEGNYSLEVIKTP